MDSGLKILILDDEPIVCARLKPALEKAGYTVETFTDSRQAKERLEKKRFDIVVTDYKMAEIDGLALFRFVKEKWPTSIVIIVTGFATVQLTREALQAGAYDVIPKPFKIGYLKEVIDKAASRISDSK